MKKVVAIFIVIFSIFNNIPTDRFSLGDYFDGEISYYTKQQVEEGRDLGFCYVGSVDSGDLLGESVVLYNAELNSILKTLKARTIKVENLNGRIVVYANSSIIPVEIDLFGSKVNLQIAYTEDRCVIGWPLILGDF